MSDQEIERMKRYRPTPATSPLQPVPVSTPSPVEAPSIVYRPPDQVVAEATTPTVETPSSGKTVLEAAAEMPVGLGQPFVSKGTGSGSETVKAVSGLVQQPSGIGAWEAAKELPTGLGEPFVAKGTGEASPVVEAIASIPEKINEFLQQPSGQGAFEAAKEIPSGLGEPYVSPPVVGKGTLDLISDYLSQPSGQGAFEAAKEIPIGLGEPFIAKPVTGKTTPQVISDYLGKTLGIEALVGASTIPSGLGESFVAKGTGEPSTIEMIQKTQTYKDIVRLPTGVASQSVQAWTTMSPEGRAALGIIAIGGVAFIAPELLPTTTQSLLLGAGIGAGVQAGVSTITKQPITAESLALAGLVSESFVLATNIASWGIGKATPYVKQYLSEHWDWYRGRLISQALSEEEINTAIEGTNFKVFSQSSGGRISVSGKEVSSTEKDFLSGIQKGYASKAAKQLSEESSKIFEEMEQTQRGYQASVLLGEVAQETTQKVAQKAVIETVAEMLSPKVIVSGITGGLAASLLKQTQKQVQKEIQQPITEIGSIPSIFLTPAEKKRLTEQYAAEETGFIPYGILTPSTPTRLTPKTSDLSKTKAEITQFIQPSSIPLISSLSSLDLTQAQSVRQVQPQKQAMKQLQMMRSLSLSAALLQGSTLELPKVHPKYKGKNRNLRWGKALLTYPVRTETSMASILLKGLKVPKATTAKRTRKKRSKKR